MKFFVTAFAALCFLFSGQAEEEIIPKGFSPDRYEPLWKKSPFALSSVVEEGPGGFAENFVLAGILKIGDKAYADVLNKETKERMFLSSKPNEQDIRVEKLESGGDINQVVVTLKKGNEVSVLRFDQEYLNQSLAQAAPPAAPNPAVQVPSRSPINPRQPPQPSRQSPTRRIIVPSRPPPSP